MKKSSNKISDTYFTLLELFPDESYHSRASAFYRGLNASLVSEDEVKKAREYYGRMWYYVGD